MNFIEEIQTKLGPGRIILDFLLDYEVAKIPQIARAAQQFIQIQLSHYIRGELGGPSSEKHFEIDEQQSCLKIFASKVVVFKLIFECFKLRADINKLEIIYNIEGEAAKQLFVKKRHLLQNIEVLTFRKYHWYDDRSEPVADFLRNSQSLKRVEFLNVNDCFKSFSAVLEALVDSRSISELRYPINAIGSDDLLYLLKWIDDNSDIIEEIDFSYEIIEDQKMSGGQTRKVKKYKESHAIKCLEKFIQVGNERISTLKRVKLNSCELEKPGAKKISQLLQSKIQVEVLNVADNNFGNDGLHEIAKGIDAGMPPLLELDLSSNHIDEKGANKLIKALNSCNILQKLLLNDNQLNPEGSISVIENLLPYLPNLKELGLAKNFMKDEGCHILCEYLSVPQCPLQVLNISDNFITEDSGQVILGLIDYNQSYFMFDDMSDAMIKRNSSLTEIDVSRNDIANIGRDFRRVQISRVFKIKVIADSLR